MYKGHKIIALCIARAYDEDNFEFIEALNHSCEKNNYKLFIYHCCSNFYRKLRSNKGDKAVFKLMNFDIIDAVIIHEVTFLDKSVVGEIVQQVKRNDTPLIIVGDRYGDEVNFDFDDQAGFEEVVRHVVEYHKATNTCMIAGLKGEPHSERRIEAYKKVLAENGIAFDESRLFYGEYWWGPVRECMGKIMESGNIPEAIICANDDMAITVCEVLKEHNLRVPEDVIVTGFDGIYAAKSHIPSITTCKRVLSEETDTIMEVISDTLENKPVEKKYSFSYHIDICNSCGCESNSELPNIGRLIKGFHDRFFRYQDDEQVLYEMTESVIECYSPNEFAQLIDKYNIYGTSIILNKDCLDETINPTVNNRETEFDDDMILFYQAHTDLSDFPKPIKKTAIAGNLDDILDKMDYPVIISSLSYQGIPMGYVSFAFSADFENYAKISQFITTLNTAIGNYRITKHLEYMVGSLEQLSKHDSMTSLCNRKGFYNCLPEVVSRAKRENKHILVATIDIDGLKHINDNYGHEEGDFAIKTISDVVERVPYPDKICGRFGGDEFVICAVCNKESEENLKSNISEQLKIINERVNKPYPISASVGVCIAESSDFDFEAALKISDDEMYIMKIGRPNRRKN